MANLLIKDEKYENAKKEAWECYAVIGRMWCPVLNDYVNFNRIGFGHLVRKGMRPRTLDDQMRRFRLLKYAKNIIGSENSLLVRKDGNVADGRVKFWAVAQKVDNRIIVIVIRQTEFGQKHFFSIYDQKTAQ